MAVVAEVTLEADEYTVGEGEGTVTVCASLPESSLEREIAVNISTSPDSAFGLSTIHNNSIKYCHVCAFNHLIKKHEV